MERSYSLPALWQRAMAFKIPNRLGQAAYGLCFNVTGWSMGALQTFHWGALYPDMVERILPFCGSAKCSRHNFVFLEGVKAALTADADDVEGALEKLGRLGIPALLHALKDYLTSESLSPGECAVAERDGEAA